MIRTRLTFFVTSAWVASASTGAPVKVRIIAKSRTPAAQGMITLEFLFTISIKPPLLFLLPMRLSLPRSSIRFFSRSITPRPPNGFSPRFQMEMLDVLDVGRDFTIATMETPVRAGR